MSHPPIHAGLDALRTWVREQPALEREFEASLAQFFRDGAPGATDPVEFDNAMVRHTEWFCLENVSDVLGCRPIDALAERLRAEFQDEAPDESLFASHAGIFVVTSVEPGRGLWLRDLAAFGEYPVDEVEASRLIEKDDVIVGRVYPVGDTSFLLSRAMGVFRNPELLSAMQADLERAREHGPKVLRLSQQELEGMFFGARAPESEPQDAVGEARRYLGEGGLPAAHVDAIFEALSATPFDSKRWAHGAGDVLARILDQLAFETRIDLEGARRYLLEAWKALHSGDAAPGSSASSAPNTVKPQSSTSSTRRPKPQSTGIPDRDARARALEHFEAGRASGADLEELFAELERDLHLDDSGARPAASAGFDEGAGDPLPDFPGVVAAMVEEFLWERSLGGGPTPPKAVREAEALRAFGRWAQSAGSIGVFENLSVADVLRFTTFAVPEGAWSETDADYRRLAIGLLRFSRWADANHDLDLAHAVAPYLRRLSNSLPRIADANTVLARGEEQAAPTGRLYELREPGRRALVTDVDGEERRVELDDTLARHLLAGDRLRAEEAGGKFEVLCCYPPEVAALEEHLS